MRKNGQYLKWYNAGSFGEIVGQITRDWEEVYSDCRIGNISVVQEGAIFYYALVVFEEV